MKNPKTTILGYLMLASAVLAILIDVLTGNFQSVAAEIPKVMAALGGVGLIAASDGGH